MRRVAVILSILATLAVAAVLAGNGGAERVTAEAGAIERQAVARAIVVPEDGVARVTGPPGKIRKLHVRVGDVVGRGVELALVEQPGAAGAPALELPVVSPIAATVIAVHAAKGDDVLPGAPLFELADVKNLEARIEIDADGAAAIEPGQAVTIRPLGGGDELARATLERITPMVGARTIGLSDSRVRAEGRVLTAFARIPRGSSLVLGEEIEAVIALGAVQVAARLPHRAVVIEDGRAVVRLPGRLYDSALPVRLGHSDEHWVEVLDLAPGTEVVNR